jgi:hypothetical protein
MGSVAKIVDSQSRTTDKGWASKQITGRELTTSRHKKKEADLLQNATRDLKFKIYKIIILCFF